MYDEVMMEVDFQTYCKTCKHKDVKEVLDPCDICLANPGNANSRKPVCYEEKEE